MSKYYWAIYRGRVMLPFTIRTTKKQCIADHQWNRTRGLLDSESCRKVTVSPYAATEGKKDEQE